MYNAQNEPKARDIIGLDGPSPPYSCKNCGLEQEDDVVFEKGLHLSPRSPHLNKPFLSHQHLSLAFVAVGS